MNRRDVPYYEQAPYDNLSAVQTAGMNQTWGNPDDGNWNVAAFR